MVEIEMKKTFHERNKILATPLLCGVCLCVFNCSYAKSTTDDVTIFDPTEDSTLSEVISDNGYSMSIVKNGSAKQTLTGNNTYTGSTTINGGILVLTGSNTYTGLTNVSSGAGLTVSGGGSLTGTAAIHNDGSITISDGTVSITGRPTDKNHGQLLLGMTAGSSASLNVESGSTITAKDTYIQAGWAAGSTGTITLDRHSMITSKLLLVGEGGTGIVTVEGGSSVTADVVGVGNSAGSTGKLSVTENDSTLTASQQLYVNLDGSGTVSVSDGGVISTGSILFGDGASNSQKGTLTVGQAGALEVGGTNGIVADEGSNGSYQFNLAGGTLKDTGSDLTSSVNATLVDDTNSMVDTNGLNTTLSGVLSGNGSLTVSDTSREGKGILTLMGANTYTGATTISAGTLQLGDGGTTGDISGSAAIHDNSTLVSDRSNTLTLSQAIDGTGDLIQKGTGTTILAGANTYTGATTISAGTLQLGDGGTTGDIAGSAAIHDNSTLVSDRSNTLTLSQAIDGTGDLVQKGTGTTILTGANTYTGGTTVSSGTLVGTTSSFGSGTITNHASLTVDQDTDGTLTNKLEGDGLLSKTGVGIVNIYGDDTEFTGSTNVDSGTLSVYGLLSNSKIAVNSGATLSGTGTVGSTRVASEGTLSPAGNGSIGTINIHGDLAMSSGSVLTVDGTASETGSVLRLDNKSYAILNSDLVKVSGSTDISGGSVDLKIDNASELKYGQAYQIIFSSGGISGKFNTLNTNLTYLFLSPSLVYTADSVDILLRRNNTSFSKAGNTRNQQETGRGIDYLSTGNSVVQAMEQLNGSDARKALDSLSGEIHASARTAMIEDAFFVREAALNRLALADCDGAYSDNTIMTAAVNKNRNDGKCYSDRAVFWGEAYGGLGRNFGNGNAATMNHTTAGFIMGVDAPIFETGRIGTLVGYGSSTYTISSGRASSGHSNNVTLGVYGSNHWGNLYLSLGASYTWDMITTQRTATFNGYQGSRLSSSYLGGTAQAFGELGYKMHGKSMVFEPFARVAYVNMMTNAFHEHGGLDALDGSKTDTGVTFSTFGFRASKTMKSGNMFITPHIMMGYRHAYGLTASTTHETFAAGAGNMDISGVPLAADSAVLNAGFSVKASDRLNMGLSYVGQYAVQSLDNGVRFRLTYKY
ncbi:autotransporter domain-containing protein [Acetobacter orientalis]|uniref:autotransporter domain-containing protein n=1 Tax=Acetobacter orientalis TaxID=146474 RepID=UPI0039EB64FF